MELNPVQGVYKSIGRLSYLCQTIACNLLVSLVAAIVQGEAMIVSLVTIIAAAYYAFWVAKQRLMDIVDNQHYLQAGFTINWGPTLSFWGAIFWLYFILISGISLYIAISTDSGDQDSVLAGSDYMLLLMAVFIPIHLYLIFKPGRKANGEVRGWVNRLGNDFHQLYGKNDKTSFNDLQRDLDAHIKSTQDREENTLPELTAYPQKNGIVDDKIAPDSIENALKLLNNLYYKGLISADELEEKRSEIISRI
jgi:hypothetical protein